MSRRWIRPKSYSMFIDLKELHYGSSSFYIEMIGIAGDDYDVNCIIPLVKGKQKKMNASDKEVLSNTRKIRIRG